MGSSGFTEMIKEKLGILAKGRKIPENDGGFQLRDNRAAYIVNLDNKKDDRGEKLFANRRELLTNLFAADPQWKLSGRPGILAILHTWSQTLIDHFHIHCLVPAGALSFDKRRWK